MSNSFVLPFNYEPAATVQTSSSYTVPAGKYAIAKITLNASVFLADETSIAANGDSHVSFSGGNESKQVDIVLKTGDVLTKVETAANKTVTLTAAATTTANAVSLASILVNTGAGAVLVSRIRAAGSLFVINIGSADTIDIDGFAEVHWHIQEYNIIS
jgi:hypothetical protein